MKRNAKKQIQRPTKVLVVKNYREKLKIILLDREQHNSIRETCSNLQGKPHYATTFLNRSIIIPQGDATKGVLGIRHLNANTDQAYDSWPIEPFASQIALPNEM